MKLFAKLFLSAMACLGMLAPAAAQPAEEVAGAYGVGAGSRWFFNWRDIGGGQTFLQFTDIAQGTVRILRPQAEGYVGGTELTDLRGEALQVRFDSDGAAICTSASAGCVEARRIPIRRRAVAFEARGVTLHGTLWLPPEQGRHPAVLIAQGSEETDRYSLDPMPQILASRGYVVLTYDKRGVGESDGEWEDQGIEDIAADLRTAFENVLLAEPEVDRAGAGIIGFSEGAWTALEANRQGAPFAFLVALSGGVLTKAEALLYKEEQRAREQGLEGEEFEAAMREHRELVAAARERVTSGAQASGFDRRITYDPVPAWHELDVPLLWMAGEWDVLDDQVRSAGLLSDLLRGRPNTDSTLMLFPRANHALLDAPSALPSAWQRMAGIRRYTPGFWPALLQWLDDRTESAD